MSLPLFACLRSTRDAIGAFEIARDFSPRIQRHAEGCVVFDASGLGSLLGDANAIGMELHRAVAEGQRAITVAVATTQTGAMLLSVAGDALTVVTNDIAAALSDLPLIDLQQMLAEIHGVTILWYASCPARKERPATPYSRIRRPGNRASGRSTCSGAGGLRRSASSRRCRQRIVAARSVGPVSRCSSSPGHRSAAAGAGPRVPRYIERMELEWPIDTLEPLSFVLARLLDPLAMALERADRGAAAIRLDLRLVDRTMHTPHAAAAGGDARSARAAHAADARSRIASARRRGRHRHASRSIRRPGRVVQYSLLERAVPSAETVATLTARLSRAGRRDPVRHRRRCSTRMAPGWLRDAALRDRGGGYASGRASRCRWSRRQLAS